MTIGELFAGLPGVRISGDPSLVVTGVSTDSRKIRPGDLFVALVGARSDGKEFAAEAVRRGAVAVASETGEAPEGAPGILFPSARQGVGEIASRIHGEPSRHLGVVGVTGTNGKTTTAHLLEAILARAGKNPACLGTVGYRWNGTTREASHTTAEASDLHAMLAEMRRDGVTDVVLECSSHGLELGRLGGLALDVGIFTNLTRDHLDFHKTFEAYREAKWKLFSELLAGSPKEKRAAVVNVDDPTGRDWAPKIGGEVVTFSTDPAGRADLRPLRSEITADGIRAELSLCGRRLEIRSSLVGAFNLSNLLAATGAAHALGIPAAGIAEGIGGFVSVPGRLERVPNGRGIHLFVDYAHTDDALENVLRTLAAFRKGRLIVVFGCGGDRDRGKRPKMAAAACRWGDVVIVTSDNPRSEEPGKILKEIESGIPSQVRRVEPAELSGTSRGVACSMAERRAAIERALSIAREGEIVLIAGKGHETYQEVAGVRHPFDDRKVAADWFGRGQ